MKIVVMKDQEGKFISSCKLSECNTELRYKLLNSKVITESPNGELFTAELMNEEDIYD